MQEIRNADKEFQQNGQKVKTLRSQRKTLKTQEQQVTRVEVLTKEVSKLDENYKEKYAGEN